MDFDDSNDPTRKPDPVEMLRQLRDKYEDMSARTHTFYRETITQTVLAARAILSDPAALSDMVNDPWYLHQGVPTAHFRAGDPRSVLRRAFIRVFGYDDYGRQASKLAKRMQRLFESNASAREIRDFLDQPRQSLATGFANDAETLSETTIDVPAASSHQLEIPLAERQEPTSELSGESGEVEEEIADEDEFVASSADPSSIRLSSPHPTKRPSVAVPKAGSVQLLPLPDEHGHLRLAFGRGSRVRALLVAMPEWMSEVQVAKFRQGLAGLVKARPKGSGTKFSEKPKNSHRRVLH